jgi:phenylacetate-CoA ligase
MARLPGQIACAQRDAPAFASLLRASMRPRSVAGRPRERSGDPQAELLERRKAGRATDLFGGHAAIGWGSARPPARRALRVFCSPGPIYEPEGSGRDYWRMGRALYAAGFRVGDLAHHAFSYHFTPAGAMMESGAHALGCTVFPAGTGQTEMQVQAIADMRPDGYIGTPSFLKVLLEKATELGVEPASLKKASVGGEAFPPSLRDWFRARGIEAYQSYGTADLGLVAYETAARDGSCSTGQRPRSSALAPA